MPSGSGDGLAGTGQGFTPSPKTERRVAKRIKYIFPKRVFLEMWEITLDEKKLILPLSHFHSHESTSGVFCRSLFHGQCCHCNRSLVLTCESKMCLFLFFSSPAERNIITTTADGTTVAQKDFDGGATQKVSDGGRDPPRLDFGRNSPLDSGRGIAKVVFFRAAHYVFAQR